MFLYLQSLVQSGNHGLHHWALALGQGRLAAPLCVGKLSRQWGKKPVPAHSWGWQNPGLLRALPIPWAASESLTAGVLSLLPIKWRRSSAGWSQEEKVGALTGVCPEGARLYLSRGPASPLRKGAVFGARCLPSGGGICQGSVSWYPSASSWKQLSDVQLIG